MHGFVNADQMNPNAYGSTLGSYNAMYPYGGGATGTPCYGFVQPRFVRGTDDEEMLINQFNNPSTIDRYGDEISGDSVFIKGIRIRLVYSENDAGTTASFANYWRFCLCQVNSNDQDPIQMDADDWNKVWRNDDSSLITGSAQGIVRNAFLAYKAREEMGTYKIIRDSGWKQGHTFVCPNQITDPTNPLFQGTFSVKPGGLSWYLPINRRYNLTENGTLNNWKIINWALFGTWPDFNNSPDFQMRMDLYYSN